MTQLITASLEDIQRALANASNVGGRFIVAGQRVKKADFAAHHLATAPKVPGKRGRKARARPEATDAAVAVVREKGKPGRKAKPLDMSAPLGTRSNIIKVFEQNNIPHAFVRKSMSWGITKANGEVESMTYKDMKDLSGQELLQKLAA